MTDLRIGGVPEHFNLPWHLCIDNEEFEAAGLNVTWQDFNGGTGEMNDALRNGDIDVTVMLTEGIIKDIADGNPSKIIQEYIATPLIWGIHVAETSQYQNISDLEGETCAISRHGSGSHLLAYVNAEIQGWSTKNLDFKVVNNLTGALKALPEDKAQYFMWEHYTTKPYVNNGVFRRLGDCPTPWPCFVIVAREDVINKKSNDLEELLKIVNRTTKEFKNIPMIAKTLANVYKQEEKDIREWLSVTKWSQSQVTEATVKNVQDKLLQLKLIDDRLPYRDICHFKKS